MRPVKLALVQFESAVADVAANVEKGLRYIRDAAAQKADLIVFPELFLTGCDTDSIGKEYFELAQSIDGPAVSAFAEAARLHSINIAVPLPLKQVGNMLPTNSVVILDREGLVAGVYSKVHLWEGEQDCFSPGDGYIVLEMDFGKLGLLICYDAGFPEAARAVAMQGAELIIVPAAFSTELQYRWDIYFQARALENTCFVAAVNGSGAIGQLHLYGNNRVADPSGKIVLEGGLHQEEMQLCVIDLDVIARYPHPYFKDLRMDTYSSTYGLPHA
jgi:predicted amidohydrolase